MRREGRQHGMVRTFKLHGREGTKFKSIAAGMLPTTAGEFSKVPNRPTNHSKFTGKCNRPRCNSCHLHPLSKSSNKAKTTNKKHTSDVVSNYKLTTWRASGDGRSVPVLTHLAELSASRILQHLTVADTGEDNPDDGNYEIEEEEDDWFLV